MLKCFLCGAKYDETKREEVIKLLNIQTNQIISVSELHDNPSEPPLMLCPSCTKSAIFGHEFNNPSSPWRAIINAELEPKKDVEAIGEEYPQLVPVEAVKKEPEGEESNG